MMTVGTADGGGWITPEGKVIPQTDVTAGVVGFYGGVMVVVQVFEFALACLVTVIETAERAGDETLGDWEARLRRGFDEWQKATQKLTAGTAQRRLRGKTDQDLIDLIGPLITWRNFLAHRYLRVRLGSTGRAEPKMAAELLNLSMHYQEACQRINLEVQKRVAAMPRSDAPAAVRDALVRAQTQIANQAPQALPSKLGERGSDGA